MKTSGVYLIKNEINGKCYIGHSKIIEKRLEAHKSSLKSNTHFVKDMQEDFNKGDDFTFKTVKEVNTLSSLLRWESYYCGIYDSIENGYNKILPVQNSAVKEDGVLIELGHEHKLIEQVSKELQIPIEEFCRIAVYEKIYFYKNKV